jgi:CheY-like chemotaxis protein/anti-sigma regulatory factor (Ser/Thr protein kinase)
VLINLVSNAVKFSDAGRVTVRARVATVGDDAVAIEITVRDTGRGIPAHVLPHLFQRFSQFGARGAREHGGVGLGLAISRRLSYLLGGSLTVESEEGIGSTFTFTFQARARVADDLGGDAVRSGAPADRSLAVLLVEDHDASRQVLRLMLEELRLDVDEAASGAEAIARAAGKPYDVILMDVQLPGVDGLEATRRIKDAAAGPAPIVVALSAAATASDERRCREAGMDAYLLKPVRLDALAAVIRRTGALPPVERPEPPLH